MIFNRSLARQQETIFKENLENFVITTNQDLLLAGDRLWFVIKLIRNHESYLHSKLAYIEIYDSENNNIYKEKILLDSDKIAYGDIILPDNAIEGLYTMVVYSKWMSNFQDYPIGKKHFLVKNPTIESSAFKASFFYQAPPFRSGKLSIFHTSPSSENIEILDQDGNSLEILEDVKGSRDYYSTVAFDKPLQVIFQNETFKLDPSKFWWNPSDFILEIDDNEGQDFKVLTHTNVDLIEQFDFKKLAKVSLDKELYQKYDKFQISVLDSQGTLVWEYEHNQFNVGGGNINSPLAVKTGRSFQINLQGFDHQSENASIWIKPSEPERVKKLLEVINDPNWRRVNSGSKSTSLATAINNKKTDLEPEYVPMLVYRPWDVTAKETFPGNFKNDKIDIEISDEFLEWEINRKIYHQHFLQAEKVSSLGSPFIPDISYVIDEYVPFEDVESFLKNIVVQTRFRKNRKEKVKELRIVDITDDRVNFNRKPIILIDYYKAASLEELLRLELSQIDRIDVFYDRNTIDNTNLGELVGNGMLVFLTKQNDFALKNNKAKHEYFLKDVKVSRNPHDSVTPERFESHEVNLYKPQFLNPKVPMHRGRGKTNVPMLDEPASLTIESWVFYNNKYEVYTKTVQVQ